MAKKKLDIIERLRAVYQGRPKPVPPGYAGYQGQLPGMPRVNYQPGYAGTTAFRAADQAAYGMLPQYNPNVYDVRPTGQMYAQGGTPSMQYGDPYLAEQIMQNYLVNPETGQFRLARAGTDTSQGGIDYGLSWENFNRIRDSAGADPGAYNRYGQPFGTPGGEYTQAPGKYGPQYRVGSPKNLPPIEELQAQLEEMRNQVQNFRYIGKEGSYTAQQNRWKLDLKKRRAGMLNKIIKKQGGGNKGYGVQPASSGNLVNWSI